MQSPSFVVVASLTSVARASPPPHPRRTRCAKASRPPGSTSLPPCSARRSPSAASARTSSSKPSPARARRSRSPPSSSSASTARSGTRRLSSSRPRARWRCSRTTSSRRSRIRSRRRRCRSARASAASPSRAIRAALVRGAQLCVGTPGRLRQLLEEGSIHPDGVRCVVIDEADALMGGSFEADVLFIHGVLPARKQTMAFRCESSVSPVTTPTHRFRRFQHSIASPFN